MAVRVETGERVRLTLQAHQILQLVAVDEQLLEASERH